MKSYRISILILVFFALLIANPWNEALSQRGGGHHGKGFLSNLTDEQREAVHEKIKEMKDQGSTREEIRAAVGEMLEEYGIELAEKWSEGHQHGFRGFLSNLTDEQRQAVHE